MGFNYEEVIAKRAAIPTEYRVGGGNAVTDASRRAEIEAVIAQTNDELADEIEFIEVKGNDAIAEHVAQQNRAATNKGIERDELAIAEKAGIAVSHQQFTGQGSRDQERQRAQVDNRKADNEARYQMLLALQAQLDQLNIEIDALGDALDYLNKTGDVRGTMNKPYVQDAIAAWEKKHGTKFDPDHPEAKAHLSDAIGDHRNAKLKSKAEIEAITERSEDIAAAPSEERQFLVDQNKQNVEVMGKAESLFKTDADKLAQYQAEGMSAEEARENLALSNDTPLGGGFPSFARQMDDKPSFMAESNTENFNKQAAQGLDKTTSPQAVVAAESVPDFMKNAG